MVDQINHHLYRKRGFYYFSRRVPKALLGDYPKPRIVLALKTRHYRDAFMFLAVWFGPTNQESTPVMYPMYSSKPLPDGEFCFPLPADGKECVETLIN